jgi:hypothetical protein
LGSEIGKCGKNEDFLLPASAAIVGVCGLWLWSRVSREEGFRLEWEWDPRGKSSLPSMEASAEWMHDKQRYAITGANIGLGLESVRQLASYNDGTLNSISYVEMRAAPMRLLHIFPMNMRRCHSDIYISIHQIEVL